MVIEFGKLDLDSQHFRQNIDKCQRTHYDWRKQSLSGSVHRSSSDRWCVVSNENPLLLFGSDTCHSATARREELPHILPNVGGFVARGTVQVEFRGVYASHVEIFETW